MSEPKISRGRRRFLQACAVAGTGLVVGIQLKSCGPDTEEPNTGRTDASAAFQPNAWIKIQKDNTVTIMVSHCEMGQGISTAICMIVAEELEADWSKVRFEMAPVADIYKHPKYGIQWTVSSMSIHSSWTGWRTAGAAARQVFILAAARVWGVDPSTCYAAGSYVIHRQNQKRLAYGDLIDKTGGISLSQNPPLKDPRAFKIIGRSHLRLDSRAKIEGRAVFGIDVKVPGMLTATVIHPPQINGTVWSLDAGEALALPGVRFVVPIQSGVAVVADTCWQAQTAADVVKIQWQTPRKAIPDTQQLFTRWAQKGQKPGKPFYKRGDIDPHFKGAGTIVEATYDLPYQAHATPEPMNCTAHVRKNRCDIWVPTQNPEGAQEIAAAITGLRPSAIRVHSTYVGGGFGRRALVDYVGEAVEISRQIQKPVKVIWTREEDIRHDRFRPATHNVFKAVIDNRGHPVAWRHRIVGADVFAQALPKVVPAMMPKGLPRFVKNGAAGLARALMPRFVAGKKAVLGAGPLPYRIPHMRVEFTHDDPGVPICWWRSVAPSTNCFAVESFIDELAAAAGRDPYELRHELSAATPRLRKVLELAAKKEGWAEPPQEGIGRGIAAHDFQNTMMALVAEVSVAATGQVNVRRVVCAVDSGIAVNPRNIEAQVQSAIVFGLTATLKSEITIKDGATEQRNFDDFPLLRMDEMPRVEVYIVPSTRPPSGIGEVAVPPIGPAVANAVFAATGKRVRKLPIYPDDLVDGHKAA